MNPLLCWALAPLAVMLLTAVCFGARADAAGPYTVVLGIAQDAGYPQTACRRAC